MNDDIFQLRVAIEKAKTSPDGRFVSGWAYVAIAKGIRVIDFSGDAFEDGEGMDEITKAAHDFMLNARVAKTYHKGQQIGSVVESVIVDDAFAKAMGATTDNRGWWIKMEIHDESVRKQVRDDDLSQFSIGGRGLRIPVEA